MHVGVVAFGVVDQPGEQRCLTDRELAELLAPRLRRAGVAGEEEPTCRRPHAVRPLPEVHRVEVLPEDLALGVLVVHAVGEDELFDLPGQIAPVAREAVLHQLLGDGRATLGDPTLREVLEEGARETGEVDAGIRPERLVLGDDHGVDEGLRHLVELGRLPVPQADPADDIARRVVDRGGLRQLPEAYRLRQLIREAELARTGRERDKASARDQAPYQDESHKSRGDASGLRHPEPTSLAKARGEFQPDMGTDRRTPPRGQTGSGRRRGRVRDRVL